MSKAMKIFDDEKLDGLFVLDRDVGRFENRGHNLPSGLDRFK